MVEPPRVLLLGCVGWCSTADDIEMHVKLLQSKLSCGAVIDSAVLGGDDVVAKLADATAVIALEFSGNLLNHVSSSPLRLLQVPGAGTDRIDWASLEPYPEVAVCNSAGHEKAVAEYCLLGMLNHAHDFQEASSSCAQYNNVTICCRAHSYRTASLVSVKHRSVLF